MDDNRKYQVCTNLAERWVHTARIVHSTQEIGIQALVIWQYYRLIRMKMFMKIRKRIPKMKAIKKISTNSEH